MFQYAFGRRLALKHATQLKLDIQTFFDPRWNNPPRTYELGMFNIEEIFASADEVLRLAKRTRSDLGDRLLNRMLGFKNTYICEPHFHFSEKAFNSPDNVYLSGYWQTEKYFQDIEPQLREDFTFKEAAHESAIPILEKIKSTESVCVHVRRTDFIINPINGLYGVDYYDAAEKAILEKVSDPHYFVFSDDIEWCRSNLRFRGETTFVSDDFGQWKTRDDLRLMASCRHFIIANSSFSWWAVWLGKGDESVVIVPKEWFRDPSLNTRDLIPAGWIRI